MVWFSNGQALAIAIAPTFWKRDQLKCGLFCRYNLDSRVNRTKVSVTSGAYNYTGDPNTELVASVAECCSFLNVIWTLDKIVWFSDALFLTNLKTVWIPDQYYYALPNLKDKNSGIQMFLVLRCLVFGSPPPIAVNQPNNHACTTNVNLWTYFLIQWGSEYRMCPVFEWSTLVLFLKDRTFFLLA